jgi:phosphohistidine phosphatase
MLLVLVHHADAVTGALDATRPLSERGRQQAEEVAARVAARGVRPLEVWHSGKLRARETAEYYWRATNPSAPFTAKKGLQPDDDPENLEDLLAVESDDLLIVSHYPFLPTLLRELIGAETAFPQHGAVGLVRENGQWTERWREAITT